MLYSHVFKVWTREGENESPCSTTFRMSTHDDPLFPKCAHPDSFKRSGFNRVQLPCTKLRNSLEAFHSVILRFAPKNVVFPFIGMLCRLHLAAMHFNEKAEQP